MKHRDSTIVNHPINAGSIEFPSVPAKGSLLTIQVLYKNLDSSNHTISVEQSSGTSRFDILIGVSKKLDQTRKSHTFNITGFNNDLVRAVLDVGGGGTDGEIEEIKYIFE